MANMTNSIVLTTPVMLRDAYIRRVENIAGRMIPILTYNAAQAKRFRSVTTAMKLASAIHYHTLRTFYITYV